LSYENGESISSITAVRATQDGGIVAGHVEHLKTLVIRISVQGLDEHLLGGEEGVEGSGTEGDGGIIKLEVHGKRWVLQGLKGEARAGEGELIQLIQVLPSPTSIDLDEVFIVFCASRNNTT
jgi:hypothetical protein